MNDLRNWLRKIRDELNLTQAEVAKRVGVTRQFIGMIESGAATPHPETAKIIATSLDLEKYGFDWTKFYSLTDQKEGKELDCIPEADKSK
ncbi:helix-turn-helix transcriptional regulator [Ruminiclostridium papyrosolvens DSM 2782]|uniref:helix-turn-helix transcriptional regulator n=1 Tax=Ruminiclostridium papyrosolvens TaxID=29362 RepID=UPI0023E3C0CC|nr:helix-turn-helix transcriptional regulator [Ruminiclostridium papyrosolvens]WES33012.1 helix-turn-helix transcriptional regulator [Ruminiclostridium papyrosolvens DSM 2782]